MGVLMPLIIQLVKLCIVGFALVVEGFPGQNGSPFPLNFSGEPSIEGTSGLSYQRGNVLGSPTSQPNGSDLHPSPALPPLMPAPLPETTKGHVRSLSPSNSKESSPYNTSPPPLTMEGHVPSLSPSNPTISWPVDTAPPPLLVKRNAPSESPSTSQKGNAVNKSPVPVPAAPAPVALPLRNLTLNSPAIHPTPASAPQNSPQNSPAIQLSPASTTPLRNSPQIPPSSHSSTPSVLPPSSNQRHVSAGKASTAEPVAPAPSATPLRYSPQNPPAIHTNTPSALPPSSNKRNTSNDTTPILEPVTPAPVVTPWGNSTQNRPGIHSSRSSALPPSAKQANASNDKAPSLEPIAPTPVATPVKNPPHTPPSIHSSSPSVLPRNADKRNSSNSNAPILEPVAPAPDVSPTSPSPQIINWKNDGIPVASPTSEVHTPLSPVRHSPESSSFPSVAPSHNAIRHSDNARVPSISSPPNKVYNSPVSSPSHQHQHTRNKIISAAPASSYLISPAPSTEKGPAVSPSLLPRSLLPRKRKRHDASPPLNPGSSISPSNAPIPSPASHVSPAPAPSPITKSSQIAMPLISPKGSPSRPSSRTPKVPLLPPVQFFPPPPPNEDCSTTVCMEPYANTPPGSPCGCVLPMQVGLRLSVALYTFFPLVSELAAEIAAGVFMKQSQVRIIGANAASEQPDKTVVLIDLVPLGEKFDNTTAFLTYQRFWHKQVVIKASFFGDYEVLYVRYPGLPASPPLPPSSIGIMDDGPYSSNDNNARAIKPLGVDVGRKRHKDGLSGGMIAIIALSAFVAVVLCSAFAWLFLSKRRDHLNHAATPHPSLPTLAKPSGSAGSMIGSGLSSASLSFGSSIITYAGSAKTFSASEIENATDNFNASRILGEGGFGRVYSGVLEDGTKVAVKVLKRDDQQGGREFLAEIEMLSRLHHRNLVKLIGICTEERIRCLVYELIPNGSVESHLHGIDKDSAPLDWDARIKIALGAARGLAYLHEDSSPRVIHRDFKSSNILLEHDFTPKVSDFGLARTAMEEENRHISTRVMGTFGYVAPEYAMTGHLLVKSDVYSYGVVLLELLTGRKPVDMSQPPGQENLVAWARPLLTSKEGLQTIIDPSLGSDVPLDSVAKVAAIASMCVQPEVSHRPFMGEVVQALKLVCNECDEAKEVGSRGSTSQDDLSIDLDARVSTGSGQFTDPLQSHRSVPNYDSGLDTERGLSASDLFSTSVGLGRSSGSFRRHSSSGPLRTGRGRRLWQRMRRLSEGSVSEHGTMFRFWPSSH